MPDKDLTSREFINRFLDYHGYRNLTDFQKVYSLLPDGKAGPITKDAMWRRCWCGIPDKVLSYSGRPTKWENRDFIQRPLRWRVLNSDDQLSDTTVRDVFAAAFASWVAVCGIRFEQVAAGEADIYIEFGPVDGLGQVLAWAELPMSGGGPLRMRFDLGDIFQVAGQYYQPGGVFLLNVASHEIGHALGLDHIPL